MAITRKSKAARDAMDAASMAAARARDAKRSTEAELAREKASRIARHTITTVRPDGSRWTYTPPAYYTPRDARGPQTPEAMRAKLEAIKPHRDPGAPRPESIERYAARMARVHALPDVGAQGITRTGRRGQYQSLDWERMPDDADEGAPREAAALIADAEVAYHAAVESEVRFVDAIADNPTTDEIAAAYDRAERTNAALANLDALRGENTNAITRPLRGAGAYSLRTRAA